MNEAEVFVAESYPCPKCHTEHFASVPSITRMDEAGRSRHFLKFPSQVHCDKCNEWFEADRSAIDPNLLTYEFICDECGVQNFATEPPMPTECRCKECGHSYEVRFTKLALSYWIKAKNLNYTDSE